VRFSDVFNIYSKNKMSALIALTISISLLALAATWLFLGLLAVLHMQIWQAFIAWASFFHNGGKQDGILKTAICMSFGAVIGMASLMLIGPLGELGDLAAPVAVGLGAAVIVLAAYISILSIIPSSVYGFGSFGGLILLGMDMSPEKAILPTILSIVVGVGFGWLSEFFAGKMTKS
jgi:hypothetical protein